MVFHSWYHFLSIPNIPMLIFVLILLVLVSQSHSYRHHCIERLVRFSSQQPSNLLVIHRTWGLYNTRLFSDGLDLPKSDQKRRSFIINQQQYDIIQLFQVYKSQYGNLKVPHKYIIPHDSIWPEYSWGMKLGKLVTYYRQRKSKNKLEASFVRELDEIEFIWDVNIYLFHRHCEAVEAFISIYGNVTIPRKFVVPHSDEWDKDIHGYALGHAVSDIRHGGTFHDQIQQYLAQGNNITSSKRLVWDTVPTDKTSISQKSTFASQEVSLTI
jgi:Helicase associated domain